MGTRAKFELDITRGKVGEHQAYDILSASEKTETVIDVSNDTFFQKNDVDFLQVLKTGQVNKVEVKTDYAAHRTGNIFYERFSNGNSGCLSHSIADLVFYYVSENSKMYYFRLDELRKYICEHPYLTESKGGDGAIGYLIPIKDLERNKLIGEINYGR